MDSKRLYYLDWLRFFVVLILVPFHSALTFTGAGDAYIYLPEVLPYYLGEAAMPLNQSLGLRLFTDFFDDFFMHLLFCIAGMSAYFSIKNRSVPGYLKERVKKLFIPLLLNLLIWIPVLSYFRNRSIFLFTGSFLEFYPQFFNGIRGTSPQANFEWAHLWFMAYLLVFSSISVLWMKKILNSRSGWRSTAWGAPVFLACLFLGELMLRPHWPGFQNLVNDWANFSTYLLYFSLGFLLVKSPKIFHGIRSRYAVSLVLGIILYLCKILFQRAFFSDWGYNLETMVYLFLRTAVGFFLVMGFLGFGEAHLNNESSMNLLIRKWSFPFYILHYISITLVNSLLIELPWHPGLLFTLSVAVSFPFLYLLCQMVDRIPLLRMTIGESPWRKVK